MTSTPPPDFDDVLGAAGPPAAAPATASDTAERSARMLALDRWWLRLTAAPGRRAIWDWGAPAAVVLLAAFLRLWNLGSPHSLVFDETFYVKDSWTLMHLGYEASWPQNTDPQFNAGHVDIYQPGSPEFVAHPPFGKWIISAGLALFGAGDSVGWRISTAVVGILAVLLVYLIAKRMFRSTLVAAIAGGLMAVDGHAIVMSRVALLDNSVMFLALLAFGCLLLDRTWSARRLERMLATRRAAGRPAAGRPVDWGPAMWWRPWLLVAAVLLGLCSGTKWSGLYFLAFFACYTVVVDMVARRRAGVPFWASASILKQGPATFVIMVPLALATYLATWTGWIATGGGYYRHWAQTVGQVWTGGLSWVPLWFQNLWHYQVEMYNYSINLHVPHPYQANPFQWLFMLRPTSMYYLGADAGQNGCTSAHCATEITGMGNPLIWWAGILCLLYLVYRLIRYRTWQSGAILLGFGAGYLPWLLYINRTIFEFYSIAYEPYMILAIALVVGLLIGSPHDPPWRRMRGLALTAVFGVFVLAASAFFWPLWSGEQIPLWYWQLHMWIPGWR